MSGSPTRLSTEELFVRHAPFVARFLFRLGVNVDELEDVVQEVFLVAHRQGGYTAGPATPTSYLASIALRAAASHRRKARARAQRHTEEGLDQLPSRDRSPMQVLETQESLRQLQAALEHLDPELRAVLILVELEGERCAAIAAGLGRPVGTIYWRLHEARRKFRQAVDAMASSCPHGVPPRIQGFPL